MRVLFSLIFFSILLQATVYSQAFTVGEVTNISYINSLSDDVAPRIINNELHWIEHSGSIVRKKSRTFPLDTSKDIILSQDLFLDVYSSSDIKARFIQTEEYLTMQLFQSSFNNEESLPLFPEFTYCSQPSVSPSGNVLYFSGKSDEKSLTTDLFVAFKQNGKWQSPVVLSSKINSELYEITPFALSDDTLIFASNGLGGKGGYDLFIVSKDGSQWNDPIPLTELNSSGNDSDPFVSNEAILYFASDRKGSFNGYDIYSAKIIEQSTTSKETITFFPQGIEVLRASTEELLPIPTIIPIPWLVSPPKSTSTEFAIYDEWKKTVGLIAFQQDQENQLISAHLPSSVSITPKLITQLREILKNVTPLIGQNSAIPTNIIALTTNQNERCNPLKISNSTQKLLTPQLTFFWDRKEFNAVQWEVNVATTSINLLSFSGKCLPDEQLLRFNLDTVVKLLTNEDNILNCTVYLINEQSEVLEKTFSIPFINTTITKTGKSNNVWNNFYVYLGEQEAKEAVYTLYTRSILDASIAKDLQIEYSVEYKNDVQLFQKLLENNGKKVTTKLRSSLYPKDSGAYILESTLMTISFPR